MTCVVRRFKRNTGVLRFAQNDKLTLRFAWNDKLKNTHQPRQLLCGWWLSAVGGGDHDGVGVDLGDAEVAAQVDEI